MPRPLVPLAVVFAAIIAVAAALLYWSDRDGEPPIAEAPIATPESWRQARVCRRRDRTPSPQGEDQAASAAGEDASDAASGTGTEIAAAPAVATEAPADTMSRRRRRRGCDSGAEAAAAGADTKRRQHC